MFTGCPKKRGNGPTFKTFLVGTREKGTKQRGIMLFLRDKYYFQAINITEIYKEIPSNNVNNLYKEIT